MKKILFIILLFSYVTLAQDDGNVSVKTGIMLKSGEEISLLPSNAKVFSDDHFKVFIKPVTDVYYYVVYNDSNNAMMLGHDFVSQDALTILPSYSEEYQLDDKCDIGVITLMFSPTKLNDIEEAFEETKELPTEKWNAIAESYLTETKDDILDKTEDSIVITGNVRAMNEAFEERLRLFTDPKLIIKQYIMDIK